MNELLIIETICFNKNQCHLLAFKKIILAFKNVKCIKKISNQ